MTQPGAHIAQNNLKTFNFIKVAWRTIQSCDPILRNQLEDEELHESDDKFAATVAQLECHGSVAQLWRNCGATVALTESANATILSTLKTKMQHFIVDSTKTR